MNQTLQAGQKTVRSAIVKAVDTGAKTIDAYVSTYDWDRMEERFAKGAWSLDTFKANPVVLWAHDQSLPPIAKSILLDEDESGLFSRAKFDDQDEFAMKIFGLYERGFLNAFSVGFIPKDYRMEMMGGAQPERKGLVFTAAELLEYSAVPVPANPGALVARELADLACKALGERSIVRLTAAGLERCLVAPGLADDQAWLARAVKDLQGSFEEEIAKARAAAAPAAPGLEDALKQVTTLARTVKGSRVGKGQLALLKTAGDVFHEIILENSEGVSPEEFNRIKALVDELGETVKRMHPDFADAARKALIQVREASA